MLETRSLAQNTHFVLSTNEGFLWSAIQWEAKHFVTSMSGTTVDQGT